MIALAAVLGAFFQLMWGGAPHRHDPAYPDDPGKQLRGWMGKGPCYVAFTLLGAIVALPTGVTSWQPYLGAFIIGLVLAAGHNPGHGCYLNPGTRTHADNEEVAPIVRAVAGLFGFKDPSLGYDIIGMGIRYGLATSLVALVAVGTNHWLGTDIAFWYAGIGFLAGVVQLINWRIGWAKVAERISPAWLGPQFNNGVFEVAVGALLYGGLAAA